MAGEPVLRNVAAIFLQMIPDLPMPATAIFPLHCAVISTARASGGPMRSTIL
jgi:hypothetical protein